MDSATQNTQSTGPRSTGAQSTERQPLLAGPKTDSAQLEPVHYWDQRHPDFPRPLRDIPSPPKALYALGDPSTLSGTCVAIVGTRHPSAYGHRIAIHLTTILARAGATIVSGMAIGIDSLAHRAALEANAPTIAVLGAGIDHIYPTSNRRLYHQIAQQGLVLAEFPPGTKAFKGCFPRRNRIIAGLADATIVIEASMKSGALLTAQYALDANRTVAAVPGPIDSPTSQGTNHLLRDGAHLIATAEDALSLLNLTLPKTRPTLSPTENHLLSLLEQTSSTTESLLQRCNLPTAEALCALTQLELHKLITISLAGEITRH